MADQSLDAFLSGLQSSLMQTAQTEIKPKQGEVKDDEFTYFTTPAPNAIEWAISPEYLDIESVYHHVRQYQIVRDYFQLRCPLSSCNKQSAEYVDCWGKGREYLESENLLVYSSQYNEDVCPCCGSTRRELVDDGLLTTYNQLHIVAGMRCSHINTHVLTSNGLIRLKNLLPDNPVADTFYPIYNMKVYGEHGWEQASDVYYAGVLQSKVLKLTNGIEHITSVVHPVYSFHNGQWGFHRANVLSPGDYVECGMGNNSFVSNVNITEPEAALLGYFISEGSINSERAWQFTNGDEQTIDHFRSLLSLAFDYSTASVVVNRRNGCLSVNACNAGMRERLRKLGLKKSVANTKTVPESIWSAPESVVCSYLRAYFEGDGTAAVEKKVSKKGKSHKPAVACYTVSKQLALDTQQLLWNLGIECSIATSKSRRFGTGGLPFNHNSYSIRIYGKNILRYAEKIGFYSDRKKLALQECVDVVNSIKVKDDKIPGLGNIIRRVHASVPFSNSLYHATYEVESGKSATLSRTLLCDLISYLDEYIQSHADSTDISSDLCLLKRLSSPNSRFVKIDSIEDGDVVPMADLHVPGTHSYIANSVMNHNSGKTATAGIMGTYIEHRIINVGHKYEGGLSKFFHQLPKNPFEMSFIASTDVQSADTIWARYTGLRSSSPWLNKYIKWIKRKEVEQSTPNGAKPWEYAEYEKYIVHGALNLKINSMNSNSSGMAGRTRISAFIDELARFENTDSARGADEAYRVLENSLRTLRSSAYKYPEVRPELPWLGSMISISSPISEDDKAMRLLKQAPNIKGMYSGHYATWEFNPDQPREMFDDDFEKDPIGALRDFGARPPSAASPLIQDPTKFRELAIQADLQPTATFLKYIHQDKSGREYVSTKVASAQLMRDGERMIAFDAGASFDQFAAACAHGEWVTTPEGRQLVTVYDWVYRLLPENKPKRDIWFDFVVSAVDYLTKYYYIGRVEFDRWQSTYLIQQIRNKGIVCEMKGTTADQYNKFINDVNYSKVKMLPPMPDDSKVDPPFMSAPGLAFYELERLERSPDLKKVSNPRKGQKRGWDSDDVATVVVHANYLVQSSIINLDNSNSASARLKRESSGGHNWVGDGGGKLIRPKINNRGW